MIAYSKTDKGPRSGLLTMGKIGEKCDAIVFLVGSLKEDQATSLPQIKKGKPQHSLERAALD